MSNFFNVPLSHPFSISNIPFGVYVKKGSRDQAGHCATRIGDQLIDLAVLAKAGYFEGVDGLRVTVFSETRLNGFASHPYSVRRAVRDCIQEFLAPGSKLESDDIVRQEAFVDVENVEMLLPVNVGDYTDFCASEYHTLNAGRLMKSAGPPLPPAWSHIPIGYHGRASSIVVSGTPIRRPKGVLPPPPGSSAMPSFGPTKTLDMEFEIAAIVGGAGNEMGESIGVDETSENVFGLVIMNDWSAREIQGFEMVPLGPFNGKNFGTTISPWVITLDALSPFKCPLPPRSYEVPTLPVFAHRDSKPTYDICLEMTMQPAGVTQAKTIMTSNLKHLAYSFGQMLAHHTSSGCPLRAGDLLGSGTISGPSPDSLACLLEITERGAKRLTSEKGEGEGQGQGTVERTWLEDGDEVVMKAMAIGKNGQGNVGFGSCTGKILPAK